MFAGQDAMPLNPLPILGGNMSFPLDPALHADIDPALHDAIDPALHDTIDPALHADIDPAAPFAIDPALEFPIDPSLLDPQVDQLAFIPENPALHDPRYRAHVSDAEDPEDPDRAHFDAQGGFSRGDPIELQFQPEVEVSMEPEVVEPEVEQPEIVEPDPEIEEPDVEEPGISNDIEIEEVPDEDVVPTPVTDDASLVVEELPEEPNGKIHEPDAVETPSVDAAPVPAPEATDSLPVPAPEANSIPVPGEASRVPSELDELESDDDNDNDDEASTPELIVHDGMLNGECRADFRQHTGA
jgi:hypothetical protein